MSRSAPSADPATDPCGASAQCQAVADEREVKPDTHQAGQSRTSVAGNPVPAEQPRPETPQAKKEVDILVAVRAEGNRPAGSDPLEPPTRRHQCT